MKNNSVINTIHCLEDIPEPCGIIIFGASGDLTGRKLIPSLYSLYRKKNISKEFFIIGCARSSLTDESFRNKVDRSIKLHLSETTKTNRDYFNRRIFYLSGNYNTDGLYKDIALKLKSLRRTYSRIRNYIFYLATPPILYSPIIKNSGKTGLISKQKKNIRVIVEKPYGRDLESAIALDNELHEYLTEEQIYRIDHYLGKETVQNILMFRFANAIFEPVWSNQYIDNIQITVAESLGMGHRAGYFDHSGIVRDMFQNHMMQMLALVAMEPPVSFEADRIRDEKVKLMRSIRPIPLNEIGKHIIRAQYQKGKIDKDSVPGYLEEEGINRRSKTETYMAARLFIDNGRWQGVPFYLRTGKRLKTKVSQIVITFKRVPYSMFTFFPKESIEPNRLIFRVQPNEGIILQVQAKKTGPKHCMTRIPLHFSYKDIFNIKMPEAYERLLLDCMQKDRTLYWRSDGVFASWELITPVLNAWQKSTKQKCPCPVFSYPAGSWGPKEADRLIGRDKRAWVII